MIAGVHNAAKRIKYCRLKGSNTPNALMSSVPALLPLAREEPPPPTPLLLDCCELFLSQSFTSILQAKASLQGVDSSIRRFPCENPRLSNLISDSRVKIKMERSGAEKELGVGEGNVAEIGSRNHNVKSSG